MERTTVKVSKRNHELAQALSDKTGLSISDILNRLIQQGLDTTKEVGLALGSNHDVFAKLDQEIAKYMGDFKKDVEARLDALEAEVGEQSGATVKLTQEDLLGHADHEPGEEELDHTLYYCKVCATKGKVVKLDPEEQPERCPECGDKLDWKTVEASGKTSLGWVALGVLALALFAGRSPGVSSLV